MLVTGGTGFVGAHCIVQLLQQGYTVRTTIRSLNKKSEVIDMLKSGDVKSTDALSFVDADLLNDRHWDEAMKGCDYVLHIASPVITAEHSTDESLFIRPAVEGTLRVLKAAKNAGVKRVVMLSTFGAVGFSNKDRNSVTTETNWTNPNEKGMSAYEKSKGLAERAAWDFIKNEGGNLELTVINPVAILEPSFGSGFSGSFELLKHLTDGSMKSVPQITLNIIDVRDVVDLIIRAMVNPEADGQRFIASSGKTISLPQIATFLKKEMPDVSQKVSTRTVPNWVIRLAGLFNPQAKAAVFIMGVNQNVSHEKATKFLGWKPAFTPEDAITAGIKSMVSFGKLQRNQ